MDTSGSVGFPIGDTQVYFVYYYLIRKKTEFLEYNLILEKDVCGLFLGL